jgi:hypothetical protein
MSMTLAARAALGQEELVPRWMAIRPPNGHLPPRTICDGIFRLPECVGYSNSNLSLCEQIPRPAPGRIGTGAR